MRNANLLSRCLGAAVIMLAAIPAGASPRMATTADGKNLGEVVIHSNCSEAVQDDLVRGLALLHHMTFTAAEASFAAAAEADPECALAYWGQAMTYVHPLWPDTVPPKKLEAGNELLERARAASNRSARDDAYIAAIQAYYDGADRSERDRLASMLEGWKAAHEADVSDPESRLFYALALLATADGSDKSYTNQKAGGGIAEEVLADYPKHPGAHHYVIHAYDFPPLAEKALPTARSYDDVAPENSHALHMTSHIFTRRGLWPESIEFNVRAAAAAADRLPNGAISMHHFHALDYLAYAHLQRGDNEAAEAVLARASALEPPFQDHAGTTYSVAAIPARLALERGDWEAAAQVVPRTPESLNWDKYPHIEAISHFSIGMGAARTGDAKRAAAAVAALTELQGRAAELDSAYDWAIQVEIQKLSVEAWTAFAAGDVEGGLALMKMAAEKEASTEKNPVTPGEALPASELYGDMLRAAGHAADALEAYETALARSPNRLNSLYGAGKAAEMSGDDEGAAGYYGQLDAIAADNASREEVAYAREWLSRD